MTTHTIMVDKMKMEAGEKMSEYAGRNLIK